MFSLEAYVLAIWQQHVQLVQANLQLQPAGIFFFWVGGRIYFVGIPGWFFPWKFKNYFLRFQYKGESFGCPTYWRRCLGSFEWKDWSPDKSWKLSTEPVFVAIGGPQKHFLFSLRSFWYRNFNWSPGTKLEKTTKGDWKFYPEHFQQNWCRFGGWMSWWREGVLPTT